MSIYEQNQRTFLVPTWLAADPRHRAILGQAVWLYLYVLDCQQNGIPYQPYKAAVKLCVNLATIHKWEALLAEQGYVEAGYFNS